MRETESIPLHGPNVDGEVDRREGDRSHGVFLAAVTGLLFFALWVWPLHGSLWTDELGSWWVIKDSFGDAIDRAITYHGQSPLYYAVAWAATQLGGRSETVLRLPSLVAGVAAAYLFYRLMRRLADAETARLGVIAFVGLGGIAFAVTDARPYAMGLLAIVAATLALVSWLDHDSARWAVAYVALAVLSVWIHYMFALVVPAQIIYALVRARAGATSVKGKGVILAAGAIVAGVIPLAAQVASLWGRRGTLAVPNVASLHDLFVAMFPPVLIGGIVLGVLLARAQTRITVSPGPRGPGVLVLMLAWLMIAPFTLFALSLVADQMFLAPRYYVSAAPAAAGLFALTVRAIGPALPRRIVVAVFAILTVLMSGGALKNAQDWRGVAEAERALADDTTVVLMHPAFVESAQVVWLADPERRSYLMSPTAFYDFDGRIVPLPYVLDAPAERYLEEITRSQLAALDRFLIVTNYSDVPFASWLDGRLGDQGWTSMVLGSFGSIQLIEFTRDGDGRSPA